MELLQEKALVERAKKDPEAFSNLFDLYYPKILNYTIRRLGNVETAKDITSIVFIKVLMHIPKFRWKDISFSSWVYKIASNEIYDYFRNGKKARTHSLETMREFGYEPTDLQDIESELIAAEKEIDRHQLFIKVQKQILALDFFYQEVLILRYFEQKKTKEIAEILGKKEGTVKSLLSRGLRKLRVALETQPNGEETVIKEKAE